MRYDDTTNAFKIVAMCAYDGNASYDMYAVQDETTTGHILARDASALTWSELLDLTTYVPTGGIIRFNGNLHWGTTTHLGKYDGTTQTDNYKALKVTQTTGKYIPMVVFSGKLYVGNMRYVATLDTTETWDDDKLILPAGQRIVDMRTFNDSIQILTTGDTTEVNSHVYTWDGTSATWDENIQINDVAPQALFAALGILLIFGSGGRIWGYAGQSAEGKQNFDVLAEVPGRILIQNPSCVVEHEGLVVFGVLPKTSNSIGIWAFGRLPLTGKTVLFQKYTPLGSYYYDAGVVDYYGVTSLINTSDPTSGYTVENNTGDTFADSDAVGTQTWDTPANAELSDNVYATCLVGVDDRGYIAGGDAGAGSFSSIEALRFATDTMDSPSSTITARSNLAGFTSSTKGYWAGGGGPSAEIDGITYADESANNPAATLATARSHPSGVNSTAKGYAGGGVVAGPTASAEIDGIVFSDESANNPAVALTVARSAASGVSESTYGYWGGGSTTTADAGVVNEIDGIKWSDESSRNPASTLVTARYRVAPFNSTTRGFWAGGTLAASTLSSEIDGITFATEASYNPAATLSTAKRLAGGFNSSTNGFVAGGNTGSYSTAIEKYVFSDDSISTLAAVLATARDGIEGVQSGSL